MRGLSIIGILLLVLGALALLVPVPQQEHHGVKIGKTDIGVETEHRDKLPPAVGGILLAGGIAVLVVGSRKG